MISILLTAILLGDPQLMVRSDAPAHHERLVSAGAGPPAGETLVTYQAPVVDAYLGVWSESSRPPDQPLQGEPGGDGGAALGCQWPVPVPLKRRV